MSGNLRAPQKLWTAAVLTASAGGSYATLLINPTGADNAVLFTAVAVGVAGNSVTITVVKDATAGTESVVAAGNNITIHTAADGSTTANTVITKTNASVTANLLVAAALGQSDISGTGAWPSAIGQQSLAGGVDSLNSPGGNIGSATNVNLFVKTSGASSFKLQAAASAAPSAGRNGIDNVDWYDYIRAESLDEAASGAFSTHITSLNFAGAGAVSVDLSPFAPTFLRLVCLTGTAVTVTAFSVSVG